MALLYLSLAWLAGVYLGAQLPLPEAALIFAAIISAAAAFLFHRSPGVTMTGLCFVILLGGMLRFQLSRPTFGEGTLTFYNDGGAVTLTGRVVEPPDEGKSAISLRLEVEQIELHGGPKRVSGLALLRLPYFPGYRFGDRLRLHGRLETPPRFDDFNYRDYLARQGIYSLMRYPKVEALERGDLSIGDWPRAWLYELRGALAQALSRALPEPQASLAQGILLGIRSNIPTEVQDAFSRTGTTHIVAISGHNLSLIAGFLIVISVWALGRQRSWYFLFSLGAIWVYAALTGAAPPVIRAAIMASLVLWAGFLGRQATASVSLAFAAAVMVGLEPDLLWDVGFQLSFLAMAGLLIATSPFPIGWRGAVAATAGATLATLPIIALNFHRIPLVALPATLVALPALGPIIATSALTALVGLALPPLAFAVSWAAWLCLSYLIEVVRLWAHLPLASLEVGPFAEPWAWAYYGALLGLLLLWRRGRPGLSTTVSTGAGASGSLRLSRLANPALLLSLSGAVLLVWSLALAPQQPLVKVSFLDVGQGDAILIEVKGERRVLVDGGPSPQAIANALDQQLPFWDRHLDLVILTHPEADHLTGLIEVLRRYPVDQVMESGLAGSNPAYEEWQATLKERGLEPTLARRGQRIILGQGVHLDVLHPGSFLQGTASDSNNNSLVLRLVVGEVSVLLSGDIEDEGEAALLASGQPLSSTVLKVPHHGSATSLSRDILEAVSPQLAVISVGRDNPFGHPHPQTLDRLKPIPILRTDEMGSIELTSDGQHLKVALENPAQFAPAQR